MMEKESLKTILQDVGKEVLKNVFHIGTDIIIKD